jgi:hypothetical protein
MSKCFATRAKAGVRCTRRARRQRCQALPAKSAGSPHKSGQSLALQNRRPGGALQSRKRRQAAALQRRPLKKAAATNSRAKAPATVRGRYKGVDGTGLPPKGGGRKRRERPATTRSRAPSGCGGTGTTCRAPTKKGPKYGAASGGPRSSRRHRARQRWRGDAALRRE